MNSQSSAWPPSSPAGAAAPKAVRRWDSGVHWSQIETCDASKNQGHQAGDPANPCYDWSHLDEWVSRASAQGMDVIYTLGATPDWATSQPMPAPSCANYNDYACVAPKDVMSDGTGTDASFIAFLTALATRYKGKIAYYEGWNEPDSTNFYDGTTAAFSRGMMKDVSATVKAIDPAASDPEPVVPRPGRRRRGSPSFLDAGGADWFDIVNFHGRGQGDANIQPESFLTVFGQAEPVLASHNLTGRPFWDDEAGYLKDQVTDVDQQEAYVARAYVLRAGAGIGRFYWYQWDSKGGYGLQSEPGGDGYTRMAGWIVGATVSMCTSAGSDLFVRRRPRRHERRAHLGHLEDVQQRIVPDRVRERAVPVRALRRPHRHDPRDREPQRPARRQAGAPPAVSTGEVDVRHQGRSSPGDALRSVVDLLVSGEHRDEMLDALGARLGLLGPDAKEHGEGRVERREERGGAGVYGERGGQISARRRGSARRRVPATVTARSTSASPGGCIAPEAMERRRLVAVDLDHMPERPAGGTLSHEVASQGRFWPTIQPQASATPIASA